MFTMNTVFEHGILKKQMQHCILSIKLCLMQSSRLAVLSGVSFQNYVKYFISYQIEIYFALKYTRKAVQTKHTLGL